MKNTITALFALAFALTPSLSFGKDRVSDFISKLGGKIGDVFEEVSDEVDDVAEEIEEELDDRDFKGFRLRPESVRVRPPLISFAPKKETRSLQFSSSGAVPSSLRRDQHVQVSSGRVSYDVDPSSKLSRDDILFVKGSTEFADRYSWQLILDLAEAMMHPSLRDLDFVIEGHASADGSDRGNMDLSQRRAERIVRELVNEGVSPRRLLAVGYGETEARYSDRSSERLLAKDRRVVVYRLD